MASREELKLIGESIHKRLLVGTDMCVSAELCELFLPLLKRALDSRFPNLYDPHLTETFAIDTLMRYLSAPEKFNPGKSNLIAYLYMDACGDLLNFLDKQKKFVELHLPFSEPEVNLSTNIENLEDILIEKAVSIADTVISEVTDPVDLELIKLMLQRERNTDSFAEILGILDLNKVEKFAEVKKHKDRLKAKLKRLMKKLYGKRLDSVLHHSKNRKNNE
jgi:hypothetical protein